LFKFGAFKKNALFWADFQRIEKMSASLTKFANRSFCSENNRNSNFKLQNFLTMRQTFFSFAALFAFTLLSSFINQKEEYGKAGYYADSLHGRKTASGEKYDKYEFTCAHKTLAFGTKIKVTRLDNKKSVIVRVNDRGPFVEGYVTDISRAAAEEIGLIKLGVTRVKIEVVEASATARVAAETDGNTKLLTSRGVTKTVSRPAQYSNELQPAGRKGAASSENLPSELYAIDIQQTRKTGFGVQVSTIYNADNVLPIIKKLQQTWPGKVLVNLERDEVYNKSTYRVIIGPFSDNKTAALQQKNAAKKGYKGCFVVDLGSM